MGVLGGPPGVEHLPHSARWPPPPTGLASEDSLAYTYNMVKSPSDNITTFVPRPPRPRRRVDRRVPPIAEVAGRLRDRGLMAQAAGEARYYERFDALASELRLTFFAAYESLVARVEDCLARFHLVPAKFNILMILRDSPTGRLSMGEIAELLLTSPRNMTALIDSLEAAGLVRRYPSETDRRVTLVGLTPEGEARLAAVLPVFYGLVDRYFAGFSEDEKLCVIHGLNKLRLAMAQTTAEPAPPAERSGPSRRGGRRRAPPQ